MKISIFTPTHKADFLEELYESIKNQTYQNWERIIVCNNGATIPTRARSDERIKAFEFTDPTKNIGYRKNKACELATWDILLEADHDDLLTPDCLEEVNKAFEENPNVWFVYSDNAKLWNFVPYNPMYGRSMYHHEREWEQLPVMKSLPEIPNNLAYIRFMPDHVRAWRKTTYQQVGWHNPWLEVCDDQELIIRTYLVSEFLYIPKCLYIYRITGDNTSLNEKNQLVQQKTIEIYDKYIYRIAERRTDLKNYRKIDLCWGIDPAPWYRSIDLINWDIIANLDEKRPLEDNSVGVIRAHDALEHLKDKQHTMKEIYRVLAPGWILLSSTPSTDGRWAFQDPTHVAFWNENSFRYRIKTRVQPKYIYNTEHLFMESRLYTRFPTDRHRQYNISYIQANLYKPL